MLLAYIILKYNDKYFNIFHIYIYILYLLYIIITIICNIKIKYNYHLPDLTNIIFSSTSNNPWFIWIPVEISNFIGVTTVNKLK